MNSKQRRRFRRLRKFVVKNMPHYAHPNPTPAMDVEAIGWLNSNIFWRRARHHPRFGKRIRRDLDAMVDAL